MAKSRILPARTSADPNASADVNELAVEALDYQGTEQLTQLTEEASPGDDDLFLMERDSDGALRKVKGSNLPGSGGGGQGTVSSKSANYTITDGDGIGYILMTTGTTDRIVNLPTLADNQDRIITIKKIDSLSGICTVQCEGFDEFNGGYTNKKLTGRNEYVTVIGTSATWQVIAATYTVNGMVYTEAQKTSAQAIPNGSLTTITGLSFTPSQDGIYEINYMTTFYNGVNSDRLCYASLFKNSTEVVEAISHITFNTSTTYTHAVGTWIGSATTADTFVLKAYSLGSGNTNVGGSASFKQTGWSIKKIANEAP